MSNADIVKAMEQKLRATLRTLPKLVGNEVVNFTKDNFRRQGFLGDTLELWRPRKQKTKWGVTPRNKGRAILIDTGKMRRANRVTRADWSAIVLNNSMPYAKAHNEGLRVSVTQNVRAHTRKRRLKTIAVKAHTRKIMMQLPKRKFIGDSAYLRRNIHRLIASQLNKAYK